MNEEKFTYGDIVYHEKVYNYAEPLKVIGIIEDELCLEGDFSGGTHNVVQRDWMPIKGTSKIENFSLKKRAKELAKELVGDEKHKELAEIILKLTNNIKI